MSDKLRAAFDGVRAGEDLKERTRDFLARETRDYGRRPARTARRLVPALACLALLLVVGIGGWRIYFTPAAVISVDINPSVELAVNHFDRVVGVAGLNPDGEALADALDVRFLTYTEALDQVMASQMVADCLARDEVLSIAVVCDDETRSQRMLAGVEQCTQGQRNTVCCSASHAEVEEAHDAGLSYGKYRAFLDLQALDPSITAEDVQGLTMREILDWTQSLLGGEQAGTSGGTQGGGGNGAGPGQGYGHRHGWDHE